MAEVRSSLAISRSLSFQCLTPSRSDIFPIVAPRPKMKSSQSFKTPFKTVPPTPAELTVISTAQRGKKGKVAAAPQGLYSLSNPCRSFLFSDIFREQHHYPQQQPLMIETMPPIFAWSWP